MNTDDLRSVLDDRASALDATGPVQVEALRGRITTYRRRRTAAGTVAVSLVVAGLVALSLQGPPTVISPGPDPKTQPDGKTPTGR